jgi:phosphate transport system substrate-binding protein
VAALVLVLALVAGACSSSKKTSTTQSTGTTVAPDTATLQGAGSTFVKNILDEWVKRYKSVQPGVRINYQAVGSGAGIQQLIAKTVDFAGSDVALKPDEATKLGGPDATLQVPWVAGGIAVEYNLPSVKDLKLSGETLASIFAGKVKKWDDPAIKADNPGVTLPSTAIRVIHRSDGSGTTSVFTSYLTAVAPTVWTYGAGKDVPWPTGTGAKGSDGVTAAVKQEPAGAIGYAEVSYPKNTPGLGIALIKNGGGQYVGPTADAVKAALAEATSNADGTLKINYKPTDPAAYPISTTTYVLFSKAGLSADKATALKHFVKWVLTDGQAIAPSLDYAPLPQAILDKALPLVSA